MKINFKIVILLLLIWTSAVGQLPQAYTSPKDVKAPNVAELIKSGNIEIKSYVGEIDYSIPLINTEVSNKSIPIFLSYDSSGFKPSEISGRVGLNWSLHAGGVITRQVNNYPDDHTGQSYCDGCSTEQNGLLVGIRERIHNTQDVFNHSGVTYAGNGGGTWLLKGFNDDISKKYEPVPDIFNFNFNGIVGKFFIGMDGEVKIITNEPNKLKVDLSGLQTQPYIMECKPLPSEIKIIDEEGNIYFFGGSTRALEYTLSLGVNPESSVNSRPIINAWHLTKIEYYNGHIVNYTYRDDSLMTSQICSGTGRPTFFGHNNSLKDFFTIQETYVSFGYYRQMNYDSSSTSGNQKSYVMQKGVILDKILGPGFEIEFNYSREPFAKYESPYTFNGFLWSFQDIQLDNLILKNTLSIPSQIVKQYNFGYTVLGASGKKRNLLTSLTEVGIEPYNFEYYYDTQKGFPNYSTFGIDHWGFWNGQTQTSTMLPVGTYDSNHDYTFTVNNVREPNFNYSLQGMLKKITYPTKGFTEFTYEPHSYTKRLESKSVNGFLPELYNVNGICGGTRIKKISDFDGVNLPIEKNYTYNNSILLKWPRYTFYFKCYLTGLTTTTFATYSYQPDQPYNVYISNSSVLGGNSEDYEIITYGEITELFNGNGKIVRKYKDYSTHPDIGVEGVDYHVVKNFSNVYTLNESFEKFATGFSLSDRKIERGKLLWEKFYDDSNEIKKEVNYEYNEDSSRFNYWSVTFLQAISFSFSKKLYYYNNFLTKITTNEFFNGNLISSIVEKEYDPLNNSLIKESLFSNSSNYLETTFEYNFIPANNLKLLISKKNFRDGIKLFEERIDYGNTSDASTNYKYLPKQISSSKFPKDNPTVLDIRYHFYKYDSRNNPVEVASEADIKTIYLWGYNKSKVIAKIHNASLSEISTALGINENQVIELNENNMSQLNNLRNLLPNSMVNTYTYSPLVGLNTSIDPKGNKFTFIYDSNQRLLYVKDINNNILTENLYHYKP